MTVFKNYRIVLVTLSTSFQSLQSLVNVALNAHSNAPPPMPVKYVGLYCDAGQIQIVDGVNDASNIRLLEAKTEKVIPAEHAYEKIKVAATADTPTLAVELYYG